MIAYFDKNLFTLTYIISCISKGFMIKKYKYKLKINKK